MNKEPSAIKHPVVNQWECVQWIRRSRFPVHTRMFVRPPQDLEISLQPTNRLYPVRERQTLSRAFLFGVGQDIPELRMETLGRRVEDRWRHLQTELRHRSLGVPWVHSCHHMYRGIKGGIPCASVSPIAGVLIERVGRMLAAEACSVESGLPCSAFLSIDSCVHCIGCEVVVVRALSFGWSIRVTG